jgi:hypothetical protein
VIRRPGLQLKSGERERKGEEAEATVRQIGSPTCPIIGLVHHNASWDFFCQVKSAILRGLKRVVVLSNPDQHCYPIMEKLFPDSMLNKDQRKMTTRTITNIPMLQCSYATNVQALHISNKSHPGLDEVFKFPSTIE